MNEWIDQRERGGDVIDVRIKLIDGSELNVWTQEDGDYWSELLQIFIRPELVQQWKPITNQK